MGLCSEAQTLKALLHLHCAIFSATCLAMPLRDKLPENCTVYMGCLAIFLLRKALHEVELSPLFVTDCTNWQHHYSVHPFQQLFSQFYGSFNKGACAHISCFALRSIVRPVAEKIAQCSKAFSLSSTYKAIGPKWYLLNSYYKDSSLLYTCDFSRHFHFYMLKQSFGWAEIQPQRN